MRLLQKQQRDSGSAENRFSAGRTLAWILAIFTALGSVYRDAVNVNMVSFNSSRIMSDLYEYSNLVTGGEGIEGTGIGAVQYGEDNYNKGGARERRMPMSRHDDLVQLTRANESVTCPHGLVPVEMVSNPEADAGVGRRIPKIVHMTGKTKCLTQAFYDAAKKWQFEGHSLYFHDDEAVMELFNRDWPMFPGLQNTLICLQGAGGAALADLWRYLALYEYGGIYTDMDNIPNTLFNSTTITNEIDAYFLQESGLFLSQYFFAVSPRHPMMFLAVHDVMRELHNLLDTGAYYVPSTTGPGATKRAFIHFMGLNNTNLELLAARYSKPRKGHYEGVGWGNHSVTVACNGAENMEYVIRTAVYGTTKNVGMQQMGIVNYQGVRRASNGKTCVRAIHEHYNKLAQAETQSLQEAYRRQRW